MDKYVLKILLALVIIIMLSVYAFNACSLEEPAAWDYNVVAGKSYEAGYNAFASKDPMHVNEDVYFSVSRGDDLIVVERKYNFAKVSKEINGEVVMGYIDAYFLSEDARSINNIEPSLATVEDAEGYYTPSLAYPEKFNEHFTGTVKLLAKANGYYLVKIADFDSKINDQIWIKEEDVEAYNSLKINLGRIKTEAKIYQDEKLLERASETLSEKMYDSAYLKITADYDEYVKLINKDGDTVVIEKADFLPLSDPSLVK